MKTLLQSAVSMLERQTADLIDRLNELEARLDDTMQQVKELQEDAPMLDDEDEDKRRAFKKGGAQ